MAKEKCKALEVKLLQEGSVVVVVVVHQRTSKTRKWNSNPENTQKRPISSFSGIFVGDVWA